MRNLAFVLLLNVSIVVSNLGCQGAEKKNQSPDTKVQPANQHQDLGFWFDGNVEQAFQLARREKKPVFLYWGAIWCPPCNDLKQEVFTQEKFHQLLKKTVPVYLDGDLEAAQKYAERFKVSGYPTVLLLDSAKKELMRFSTSIDAGVFLNSLEASINENINIDKMIVLAKQGELDAEGWRVLASYNWPKFKHKNVFSEVRQIYPNVPRHLKKVRSRIAGRLLIAYNSLKTEEKSRYSKSMIPLLDFVGGSYQVAFENKSVVFYYAKDLSDAIYKEHPKKQREFKIKMLEYAERIAADSRSNLYQKLATVFTHVEFAEKDNAKKPKLSPQKRDWLKRRIADIDSQAKTKYERKSSISTAAWLLNAMGETSDAILMLEKEAQRSSTPYYYQSMIASFLEKQKKIDEALRWSALAKKTASGRATRIQWQVNELLLNIRSMPKHANEVQVAELLDHYYSTSFSLVDGFKGRNKTRGEWVVKAVMKTVVGEKIKAVILKYRTSCSKLELNEDCSTHFAQYKF